MECAAISDRVAQLDPALVDEMIESKKTLHSIVCILSKVILK